MKKIVFLLSFCFMSSLFAQKKTVVELSEKTRVLFILDCSNSMWDKWQSDSKIKITQKVLTRLLDSLETKKELEVGLRVFGHLNKNAFGTKLEVPFDASNLEKIRSKIKTLVPKGGYSAASALSKSLNDFPHNAYSRNLIIVITDGVDDSVGNVCEVARNIEESGVIVHTYIVGIGKKGDINQHWTCAGQFVPVYDEELYASTLREIIHNSSDNSKIVLELLDAFDKPSLSNIPISIQDERTAAISNMYMYHLNGNNVQDTFLVDPFLSYTLSVHTFPKIVQKGVKASSSSPYPISIKALQGSFTLGWTGKKTNLPLLSSPVIIRSREQEGEMRVLAIGETLSLLEGSYTVEVLTTPPTILTDVLVKANTETKIGIPYPGKLNMIKPKQVTGRIFYENEGNWSCIGTVDASKEVDTKIVMPGNYMVLYYHATNQSGKELQRKEFKIESGQSTNVVYSK